MMANWKFDACKSNYSSFRILFPEFVFISGPTTILSPPRFAYVTKYNTWLRDTAFYILFVIPLLCSMRFMEVILCVQCVVCICATVSLTQLCRSMRSIVLWQTSLAEEQRKAREKKSRTIPFWNKYVKRFLEQQKKKKRECVQSIDTTSTHWHIRSNNGHGQLFLFPSLLFRSFPFFPFYLNFVRSHLKKNKNPLWLWK